MCFFGYWCCCFSFTKCHCLPISWLARFTMNYQTCWVNAVLCFIVTEQNHSELQTKLHFSEPELYLQTGQWYQFSPCIFIAHCAKKTRKQWVVLEPCCLQKFCVCVHVWGIAKKRIEIGIHTLCAWVATNRSTRPCTWMADGPCSTEEFKRRSVFPVVISHR